MRAEVINGKIYILTGADPDDAPFATIEVYAPEGFPSKRRSNRQTSQNMGHS